MKTRQFLRNLLLGTTILGGISTLPVPPANAVKFVGVNSYIYNVDNLGNLGGPEHTDSALFCTWYKTVAATGTIIQAVKYVGGSPYEMFSVRMLNGYLILYMADEVGNSVQLETALKIPFDSTWQQITILMQPASASARMLIGGISKQVIMTHQTGLSFFMPVAHQTWTVGATGATTGPGDFFNGNLDQTYFYGFNGTYEKIIGHVDEACGVNLGTMFGPIRPGPFGAYIVMDTGNPIPQIMLQGRTPGEYIYNQGGGTSFFGGQGLQTSPTDPFVLVPNLYQ